VNYWRSFNSFDQRDNVRLRTISLGLDVPDRYSAALGFGHTSMTFAANNIMWWDHCNCNDPNSNWAGASSFGNNSGFLTDPSPRTFRVMIRTRR